MNVKEASPRRNRWYLVSLFCLIAVSLGVRVVGLEDAAVGGNDTVLYYTLAERWLAGNPVYGIGDSVQVFRPALLAFNAAALKLLGHTDYAIKLANALLDVVNILLVALLAWLLSGRVLVSFSSAFAYAALPLAIWASRNELPHTLSTFLILLACVLALRSIQVEGRSLWLACLSGFSLASAAMTHEELMLVAVPLGFFLLQPGSLFVGGNLRSAISRLAVFGLAPLSASVLMLYRQASALEVLANPASLGGNESAYLDTVARFVWNGFSGAGSIVFLLLLGAGIIVFCWNFARGSHRRDDRYQRSYLFCMGIYLGFMALFALFLDTVFVRGLLPLMPLPIIALFYSLALAFAPLGNRAAAVIVVLVALVFSASNFGAYSAFKVANRAYSHQWDVPAWPTPESWRNGYQGFLVDARYSSSYLDYWGRVHSALAGQVDDMNRVLLLPSSAIYSAGRRPLQTGVYFGDDVIYRLDHTDRSIEQLVREYRVRYIVFSLGQLRRIPKVHGRYLYDGRWAAPVPVNVARDLGLEQYSEQEEFYQVMRFANAVGAKQLQLFPVGSFEEINTRVWQLP